VFPNPHDTPAIFTQNAVDPAVPRLVRGELLFPERTIASRGFAVLRASVPKAAVHKHGQSRFAEYKVRFSEYRLMAAPAGDVAASQ